MDKKLYDRITKWINISAVCSGICFIYGIGRSNFYIAAIGFFALSITGFLSWAVNYLNED